MDFESWLTQTLEHEGGFVNDPDDNIFEYVLINGVNDSKENAKELASLLNQISCKINIIPYNVTVNDYKRSENIETFINTLNNHKGNFRVLIRKNKGQDISAACGQLVTENE